MMPAGQQLRIAVVTVSDTRTEENDSSGEALIDFIQQGGHELVERVIVKDELQLLRNQVLKYCDEPQVDVVLLTGGTGITSRDVTPEAIEPIFQKSIPGFGDLWATAVQSTCVPP